MRELLGDRAALAALAENATALARGPYSWEAVAAATLELYRSLLGEGRRP
jgi:hypothetical protein